MLSDTEIWAEIAKGSLAIQPRPTLGQIKGASIDLHLADEILELEQGVVKGVTVDPGVIEVEDHVARYSTSHKLTKTRSYKLNPHVFVLGWTAEKITLNNRLAAQVHGKSGLARLGLSVHFTAPKIDPGFAGRIRLEMFNSGPFILDLQLGMEICVVMVDRLGKPAKQVYQGKFKGQ